ncbi:dTDP-4-dehydrorhamnose reductase [Acetobacter peroxydans]|uniref:dTDP-4-dehydrorhamnose reductase n=1 Tax=Acetobacter peroxydans TaxID=104098 RepID=UPI00114345E1|nr:dTDP-4-dehydrorhamnose reductase [Acetobacter peroxydans]NHO16511.1 dTDP-4-dehydrorhamnose reductase [Acetobacter peroxydans]
MSKTRRGDLLSLEPRRGNLLVVGKNGQLATSLGKLGPEGLLRIGRPDLDLDQPDTLEKACDAVQPTAIINAAAWTAVDLAENEPEAATRANRDSPQKLAAFCAKSKIPFIHISTDYVFDGKKGAPYVESDPVSPLTVYGRTKAEGEQAVMAVNPSSIILRTSWVYSALGKNFVRTIVQAGARTSSLRVVEDQKGCPTSSDDLARAILDILKTLEKADRKDIYAGIYHACGTGAATWYELATHVLREATLYGLPMPEIIPITTQDWPTPALRPADTRLDTHKLQQVFGITLPHWHKSTSTVVHEIFEQDTEGFLGKSV